MNAANREQVKQGEQRERLREEQQRSDLRTVLGLPEGLRVLAWLLGELQSHGQMWSPDAGVLGRGAALHDFGNWIRDRIDESAPEALLTMAVDERERARQERREQEALQMRLDEKQRKAGRTTVERDDDENAASD